MGPDGRQVMKDRGAKKAETVEVRVTHETKQALLREAEARGLSLSALLRAIIDRHLRAPPAEQSGPIWEPAMLILRKRPLAAVAALASAGLAVLFATATPGLAKDLALQLDLELQTQAGEDKSSWHVVEDELLAEYGKPVLISFPGLEAVENLPDQRQLRLKILAAKPDQAGRLRLDFVLEEVAGDATQTISTPSLLVALNEDASIQVQGWDAAADPEASSFTLKVKAQAP